MRPLQTARSSRRVFLLAGISAALTPVLTTAGCARHQAPAATAATVAAGAQVPASAIKRLTTMACRSARINGDPAPAWITAVATTRAKALTSAAPGDFVPGSAHVRVFLVTMRGHFTVNAGPSGAKPPAGEYLSMVIGAKSFHGFDFGVSPQAPPVSPASLGPVTRLAACGH